MAQIERGEARQPRTPRAVRAPVGAPRSKDLLHRGFERGLDLTADLGGRNGIFRRHHPVVIGPHPQPHGPRAALERSFGTSARAARLHARIPQRHQPLLRHVEQFLFRVRVHRRRSRNQPGLDQTVPFTHRSVDQRELRESLGGVYRGPHLTPHSPPSNRTTAVAAAITIRRVRARIGDPLRGLGQHAVDHATDRAQLVDHAQRLVPRERRRVELERNRFELGTGGGERGETCVRII